ncbi:aminotransferase class I/II-fold pyridoxal phosphate-dependent enzyme [Nitriliruptoraceae bacterium ZYF776]|nr:aminotransferase class I/II-fold pyridoxal phosphate-dependent enzyme [Profundirhabdus halotolerans]
MDVDLPPPVRDRLVTAIDEGDTGYAMLDGYVRAFAGFAARRWGWDDVDPARAAMAADVMVGVAESLRAVTAPDAPVVITPPVYQPFPDFVRHAGRRVVEVPLTATHRLDLDALEATFARLGPGAGFLLCNPHNPTGTVHTREELAAVAAMAAAHRVRVVADEIHAPLVWDPDVTFVPYLTVAGSDDAFVVTSASKAWNLAGLKAGLVLAGPAGADDLARIPEIVSHGPSHLGVLGQTAAWEHGEPWLDDLLVALRRNHLAVRAQLAALLPDVAVAPARATFLAWLDLRTRVPAGTSPAELLLERARLGLSAGEGFGTGGDGHVRLNVGTAPAILEDAVSRMAEALGGG